MKAKSKHSPRTTASGIPGKRNRSASKPKPSKAARNSKTRHGGFGKKPQSNPQEENLDGAAPISFPAGKRASSPPAGKVKAVVGLGASAGGLEAVTQLLRHLPKDTGMAFVLVQHLDPTHESALVSLLTRATDMKVSEARNNTALAPNQVYVIPPNKVMGISDRRLKLSPRRGGTALHTPINFFFQSLAAAERTSAIGVILSGNGADGTMGLREIKAEGGITFAQDQGTARFPTMPASAIAARCVDFVMPPDKIAQELARFAAHPYVASGEVFKEKPLPTEEKAFEDILATLRLRTGVDFGQYKHATLHRRIQRRMMLQKIEKQRDYAGYLRNKAAEIKELFNDILIHVTGFFRDPPVFAALKKKVIPRLLKDRASDDPLRIWVPGCSTGEEVYSIAMSIMEARNERRAHVPIQIFGTDVNELGLEKARGGFYPAGIQEEISPERLRRFFTKQDGGFRINKSIREMCIFARQNVVVDPPFSNLDLISCRNMLIYLGQPLQRRVLPVFHYALKPNGMLILGTSETVGNFGDLFQLVSSKSRIYSRKVSPRRPVVTFGQFQPALPLPRGLLSKPVDLPPHMAEVQKAAERILLTHYGPAGVVINSQMDVLQFRGHTGPYLEHTHGEASLNLLKMAREGLGMLLRSTVNKALKQNSRVRQESVRLKQAGDQQNVTIEVVPFRVAPARDRDRLVIFESANTTNPAETTALPAPRGRRETDSNGRLESLRDELASTRESLQTIIEEQEATNEELRSANEEIMSSNEELQSTNEELETAKEELQSSNEELTTLNEELETRNNEMDGVNNDLHNILSSVNIPILILGCDLRIRRFTAISEKIFNLIPADVGRPITDIAASLEIQDLPKVVAEVIDTLASKDIEARDRHGHWWSVRIRPYKTTDNRIDGAVIALVDIHAMKPHAKPAGQHPSQGRHAPA